jgi:hypothetical protein
MVVNSYQSSTAWCHWMNQSTIHKRNLARRCQEQPVSTHNDPHLPVAIRVWRQLFTSKQLPQLNYLVKKNDRQQITIESFAYSAYDQSFTESLSYYNGATEQQQQTVFPDDDTIFKCRSINTSSVPSTTNLLYRSMIMAGLAGSIAIVGTTTANTRYTNSPFFTAVLLSNGVVHRPIVSLQTIRSSHDRIVPIMYRAWLKVYPQVRSISRVQMLLLAWGGYELLSNTLLGPRST